MLFVGFCSLLESCVSPPRRHVPALCRSVPLHFWIVCTGPRVWISNNRVVTDHARFGIPDEVVQGGLIIFDLVGYRVHEAGCVIRWVVRASFLFGHFCGFIRRISDAGGVFFSRENTARATRWGERRRKSKGRGIIEDSASWADWRRLHDPAIAGGYHRDVADERVARAQYPGSDPF